MNLPNEEPNILLAATRLYIPFMLFERDPAAWEEFLITKGSLQELEDDLPFVLWLQDLPAKQPRFVSYDQVTNIGPRLSERTFKRETHKAVAAPRRPLGVR